MNSADQNHPRIVCSKRSIASVALAALVGAAIFFSSPRAAEAKHDLWVSPGIKIAYTIGHGFTYGLEVSFIWAPSDWDTLKKRPFGSGFAINMDFDFKSLFMLRAGGQITGPFIGLEAGPAVAYQRGEWGFGLGFTPWVSSYLIPFYTYTVVFGRQPNLHQLGAYLKLHLNTDGDFASRGSFDDDDDWD
jgi:hypothetical protein